jgi:hypothetical protein
MRFGKRRTQQNCCTASSAICPILKGSFARRVNRARTLDDGDRNLSSGAVSPNVKFAEAITTPAEGATENEQHPVTFCYRDGRLLRVVQAENPGSEGIPESDSQLKSQTQTSSAVAPSAAELATSPPSVGVQTSAGSQMLIPASPARRVPAIATAGPSPEPSVAVQAGAKQDPSEQF